MTVQQIKGHIGFHAAFREGGGVVSGGGVSDPQRAWMKGQEGTEELRGTSRGQMVF